MKKPQLNKLLQHARTVRERAYAPYSKYKVGAAIQSATGKIYTGCNVENASYGLTICAERNAIFKAVSEGEREFVAIAVVTANGGSPCGACRQVIFEFMPPDAPVALADAQLENIQHSTVGELLPTAFPLLNSVRDSVRGVQDLQRHRHDSPGATAVVFPFHSISAHVARTVICADFLFVFASCIITCQSTVNCMTL